MDNILAAKVLMRHLPEITDGAYKTATEIAIEQLLQAEHLKYTEWYFDQVSPLEYLELTQDEYDYWILRKERAHAKEKEES